MSAQSNATTTERAKQIAAECGRNWSDMGGYEKQAFRDAAREEAATPIRRHKAVEGECSSCDRERAAGNRFHPPHDASPNCESGRHNHCSCDTCF